MESRAARIDSDGERFEYSITRRHERDPAGVPIGDSLTIDMGAAPNQHNVRVIASQRNA